MLHLLARHYSALFPYARDCISCSTQAHASRRSDTFDRSLLSHHSLWAPGIQLLAGHWLAALDTRAPPTGQNPPAPPFTGYERIIGRGLGIPLVPSTADCLQGAPGASLETTNRAIRAGACLGRPPRNGEDGWACEVEGVVWTHVLIWQQVVSRCTRTRASRAALFTRPAQGTCPDLPQWPVKTHGHKQTSGQWPDPHHPPLLLLNPPPPNPSPHHVYPIFTIAHMYALPFLGPRPAPLPH